MSILPAWNYQGLHGLDVLEAQEDWLIQLTDTLGNSLHHSPQPGQVTGECLHLLGDCLRHVLEQEEKAFAELGHQVDSLHRTAHQQLELVVETLSERHLCGQPVGEHLLLQLQYWLLEHCGQCHTESLHH